MKKIKLLLAIVAVFMIIPASSFAIVDFGVYGGYNLGGKSYKPVVYGPHLGVIVHPSFTLGEVVTLGLGAYYQRSYDVIPVTMFGYTKNRMTHKDSVGLDGYVQINIPKVNLHPYGRVSTSIWDQVTGWRVQSYKNLTASEFFKTYAFGGGIAIPLASVPVLEKMNVYFEYLYTISKVKSTPKKTHTLHAGFKVMI